MEQWNYGKWRKGWSAGDRSTPDRRPARRSGYLDFDLSLSSGLVAHGAISPSLDEITTAGASGEFEVDCESILLCYGQIGA